MTDAQPQGHRALPRRSLKPDFDIAKRRRPAKDPARKGSGWSNKPSQDRRGGFNPGARLDRRSALAGRRHIAGPPASRIRTRSPRRSPIETLKCSEPLAVTSSMAMLFESEIEAASTMKLALLARGCTNCSYRRRMRKQPHETAQT